MNVQDLIVKIQKQPKHIRNLCILAHVDHGKTTLADTLLASNGIISAKMAGKLRYMDSRKDEQERGITMKSSAVSLIHEQKKDDFYLINLIDSPGHVDFSAEVSTAVRICDGAILVIDVCEGICAQTHAVLRQASIENLKLVLVLNKIDRLIMELKMTPDDAYMHLKQILEQLNAIVAQQFTSLLLTKQSNQDASDLPEDVLEWTNEIDESKLYFSPEYNNVIFASAIDGWGFGIDEFAEIYSKKLGVKYEILKKTLWGNFYINTKTKRIMKGAQSQGKKSLFVQFILDNIWLIYETILVKKDIQMLEKIINSLNIKIPPRDMKFNDPKLPLQSLFNNWLPLSRALLSMVVTYLPSPVDLTAEKVEHLICSNSSQFKLLPVETQKLKEDFLQCDSSDEKPTVVYISKMFAVERANITRHKRQQLTLDEIAARREALRQLKKEIESGERTLDSLNMQDAIGNSNNNNEGEVKQAENEYEFMAFARVLSGRLHNGQTLFVLSPKHNPNDFIGKNVTLDTPIEEIKAISKHVSKITVNELYLMMGREFEIMDQVPSGNILAIGGLENSVLKSGTLSTTLFSPSFTDTYLQTAPIVRVAIEPKHPSQMNNLMEGLRLLNQADPCVEIKVQQNGEHILCTAGEVHLQRCIDDLVELFAKCPVNVSPPRIPFRETIVVPPKFDLVNERIKASDQQQQQRKSKESNLNDGLVELKSQDKKYTLSMKAKPLPSKVTELLESNQYLIKFLNQLNENAIQVNKDVKESLKEFKAKLQEEFLNDENFQWSKDIVDRIWSFGPHRTGPNMLINNIPTYQPTSIWHVLDLDDTQTRPKVIRIKEHNDMILGFEVIASKGPLCEEPLMGVCFMVENLQVDLEDVTTTTTTTGDSTAYTDVDASSDMTASEIGDVDDESVEEIKFIRKQQAGKNLIIPLMKEACKKSFELQPQRLMAAMYKVQILSNTEALGKVYAVLGKRNGKILEETMKDGTALFLINALLPVAESFGFAEELRKKAGGLATPQLEFSHFETIDIDPFWEPKTEEEYLLFGSKADFENSALKYMNEIRKRKGLFTREKIVEHSEKQRTLGVK